MSQGSSQQANLVVLARAGAAGKVYWDARWRYRTSETEPWTLIQRRLGLAWQEPDESGGWRKRRGRCPEGWLDERAATVAAVAAMEAHARELAAAERQQARAAEALFTVRELAKQCLEWLTEVRGAKPSTIADYAFLLRGAEPTAPPRPRCKPRTDHGRFRRPQRQGRNHEGRQQLPAVARSRRAHST